MGRKKLTDAQKRSARLSLKVFSWELVWVHAIRKAAGDKSLAKLVMRLFRQEAERLNVSSGEPPKADPPPKPAPKPKPKPAPVTPPPTSPAQSPPGPKGRKRGGAKG